MFLFSPREYMEHLPMNLDVAVLRQKSIFFSSGDQRLEYLMMCWSQFDLTYTNSTMCIKTSSIVNGMMNCTWILIKVLTFDNFQMCLRIRVFELHDISGKSDSLNYSQHVFWMIITSDGAYACHPDWHEFSVHTVKWGPLSPVIFSWI
jgi:hypothetical protein